jgi:hypothetical protein
MILPVRIHPRICSMCQSNAERPFHAVWDSDINERISFCAIWCFTSYIRFKREAIMPIEQKEYKQLRRNSI